MSRPGVSISITNNNLGGLPPSEDGIAGIIVSGVADGSITLGEVMGPFLSIVEIEDAGLDADYDTTNSSLAYQHCKDFYEVAGQGSELYVMVVADTVTMTDLADKANDYAKKMLTTAGGKIRVLGITRVPDGAYTPTYVEEFDDDIWDASAKAQELVAEEFTLYRPVQILLEGMDFQGTAGSAKDLRDAGTGLNTNRVSVVIGSDPDVATGYAAKYAFLGRVLGALAVLPVQRNIGRVKNGRIPGLLDAGVSNGANLSTLSDVSVTALHDKGYIFALQHVGKAGFFFNDDPTAVPNTDDFSYIGRGRTIDKAARITRTVYLEELLDEIQVDSVTGKMVVAVAKNFEANVETAIAAQMAGEISGVTAWVDPNQNILSTNTLQVQVNIIPVGIARNIAVTLGFSNPLNN